jgi:hypothetical protein
MAAETIALIEGVANTWGEEFVKKRKAEITRIRVKSSGDLHDSVRHVLIKRRASRWVVRIRYNYYGRFHDSGIKNTMPSGGKAYINHLTDWVLRKGLYNFTPRRGGSTEAVARDVAWGIARNNANSSPWPRRKWLNPIRPDIDTLSDQIEKILPEAIVQDVVKVLTA